MFKLIDFSKHSSPILKIPINIYGARYEVRVFHEDENYVVVEPRFKLPDQILERTENKFIKFLTRLRVIGPEKYSLRYFIDKYEPFVRKDLVREFFKNNVSLEDIENALGLEVNDKKIFNIMYRTYYKWIRRWCFFLSEDDVKQLTSFVISLIYGYGYLMPLFKIPQITDIFIKSNSIIKVASNDERIMIAKTNILSDAESIDWLNSVIADRVGISATMFTPCISITDKVFRVRISLTIGDVANYTSHAVIRVLPWKAWLPVELIYNKTIPLEVMAILCLSFINKIPIITYGETGAGKTSLIMAIAQIAHPDSRVVLIQDVKEIRIVMEEYRPDCIDLMTRVAISPEMREIDYIDLFKHALRLNPDYILVPEVREKEAKCMVESFLVGHGGATSIHAENVEAVIERLKLALKDSIISIDKLNTPIVLAGLRRDLEYIKGRARYVRKVHDIHVLYRGVLYRIWSESSGEVDSEGFKIILNYISSRKIRRVEDVERDYEKLCNFFNTYLNRGYDFDEKTWYGMLIKFWRKEM